VAKPRDEQISERAQVVQGTDVQDGRARRFVKFRQLQWQQPRLKRAINKGLSLARSQLYGTRVSDIFIDSALKDKTWFN
jgi:hypothetical protein